MTDDTKGFTIVIGVSLLIGFFIGTCIFGFLNNDSIIISKQKLIEQNLAEYDSKTGEFKLKIEVE